MQSLTLFLLSSITCIGGMYLCSSMMVRTNTYVSGSAAYFQLFLMVFNYIAKFVKLIQINAFSWTCVHITEIKSRDIFVRPCACWGQIYIYFFSSSFWCYSQSSESFKNSNIIYVLKNFLPTVLVYSSEIILQEKLPKLSACPPIDRESFILFYKTYPLIWLVEHIMVCSWNMYLNLE